MAEYKCLNCGKVIPSSELNLKAKCPHCSNKILVKVRPKVVKKVIAR
ncbi:MAG TPA: DNA-directed RNA polymerase subunit P [Methanothermococcus okinawensis]|uniref:DNA-directed RNA polymerase subunit Rpo12 n=1 Tax=Methanofervidicoccus abyssi TaxID=2082189 RepID=A0A401HS40_9EURY|nr:DNA-directed RNA polymerase subunit P [Methanofervidicoccus abyssi]GBF36981.1 DNA-directed RNA polymerase subunit P [Methanofervidicoccus abyssi]HIP15943.1 DNA-directed RNA polymerase subunit P [Methanothermococcus okinawensis]HIP34486.1 DNA-directed RNA polymerase subunit P [Methanothermococcus okinawensis]